MTTQAPAEVNTGLIVRRGLRNVLGILFFTGGALFLASRDLTWPQPWILLGLYVLYFSYFIPWGLRHSPSLLEERATSMQKDDQKPWDRILLRVYFLISISLYIIAGLDHAGAWSRLPTWALWLGFALIIPAYLLPLWALAHNPFASGVVRIQEERDQQVISTGPYQVIRHPMYFATLCFALGAPLFLGSWWAHIPGISMALLFVVRTSLEDRTLQDELPGYRQYTQDVRYRLLPGIW